jgi:hypothetical protein
VIRVIADNAVVTDGDALSASGLLLEAPYTAHLSEAEPDSKTLPARPLC